MKNVLSIGVVLMLTFAMVAPDAHATRNGCPPGHQNIHSCGGDDDDGGNGNGPVTNTNRNDNSNRNTNNNWMGQAQGQAQGHSQTTHFNGVLWRNLGSQR